jgi:acetyl-CoA synthetase
MADQDLYPVPAEWAKRSRIKAKDYPTLYGRALADPGSFWLEQARRLTWVKRPEIAGDWSFKEDDFHINWFRDGVINRPAFKGTRRRDRHHLGT